MARTKQTAKKSAPQKFARVQKLSKAIKPPKKLTHYKYRDDIDPGKNI